MVMITVFSFVFESYQFTKRVTDLLYFIGWSSNKSIKRHLSPKLGFVRFRALSKVVFVFGLLS